MLPEFTVARSVRTWSTALAATAAVVILATACSSSSKAAGGGGNTTSSAASPTMSSSMSMPASSGATTGGTEVDVKNFSFSPMTMTVKVGTTVTWKFEDSAAHTVSADDKSFVSPALSNGKTYTHTFTKAGTYPYICSIHQYMKGTITVTS